MNLEQNLLIQLMEECAEVQHACVKALRFGLHDSAPYAETNNLFAIRRELGDLLGVLQVINDTTEISTEIPPAWVSAKISKIEQYLRHSRELGILDENPV